MDGEIIFMVPQRNARCFCIHDFISFSQLCDGYCNSLEETKTKKGWLTCSKLPSLISADARLRLNKYHPRTWRHRVVGKKERKLKLL